MDSEGNDTHVNVTPGLHLNSFSRFSSVFQPSFFPVSIKDGCSSTRYRRTRTARIAVASVSEKRRPMHERAPISVGGQVSSANNVRNEFAVPPLKGKNASLGQSSLNLCGRNSCGFFQYLATKPSFNGTSSLALHTQRNASATAKTHDYNATPSCTN